jgi:hypothetical protein
MSGRKDTHAAVEEMIQIPRLSTHDEAAQILMDHIGKEGTVELIKAILKHLPPELIHLANDASSEYDGVPSSDMMCSP